MGLDNRNKRSMLEGSKIMKLMTLVAVLGGCVAVLMTSMLRASSGHHCTSSVAVPLINCGIAMAIVEINCRLDVDEVKKTNEFPMALRW